MRRSTCTINYGNTLPLAQGVKFDAKFWKMFKYNININIIIKFCHIFNV